MKHEILTRLHKGEDPKTIAEDLGVSIATVVRNKAELTNAIRDDRLNTLLASAVPSAAQLVDETYENAPQEIKAAANELSKGLKALERLQPELISTASDLNKRIKVMCATAESVSEIESLVLSLAKLQSAFFPTASPGLQLNIQNNNNDGGSTYGQWLGDKPGTV